MVTRSPQEVSPHSPGYLNSDTVSIKSGEEETTEADRRAATVQEETVTFSDDRQKVTDVRPTDIVSVTNDNPYFTESILQWISRPFPVKNIVWKTANLAGARIASIPFPSSLFHIDPVWNKILNFNYFKSGVKIAIRVNGTRFHYGKLLFMWSPQSQNTGVLYDNTDNIFSASGFPHVLVSPTESETHEFVMPFAIPFPWINLSAYAKTATHHRYFDIGTVYVYVLNPLGVVGNATAPDVNISVFANFENPQLAGYTMTEWDTPPISTIPDQKFVIDPITATFSWTEPSGFQLDYKKREYEDELEAQMAINDVNDPEGAQKSEEGLISGVAERVSGIANLFTRVPLVAPVAGVVGRVASGVARIARLFGYCNPLSQEALTRMKLHFPLYTHSHGLDNAVSLTMTPNAKISPGLELLGGFPEEQTLAYLTGTPSLLYVQKWVSTDIVAKTLVTIPVSPMVVCKAKPTGVQLLVCPTVLSHTCSPFKFWRGSLRYYITVTCSSFHSGRLKISWTPDYIDETQTADSYIQVSHVLDIQDETDFSFSVPWMKHTLYAPLNKYNENTDTQLYNGFVTISVVNPVTAAMTPVGDLYINVYVSACDDFQLNFVNTEKIYKPTDKIKTFLEDEDEELEAQWNSVNVERTFWQKHVERCITRFVEKNRDVSYTDMLIVTSDVRANCSTENDCAVQIQILEKLIHETTDARQLYLLTLKLELCRFIMYRKDELEAQHSVNENVFGHHRFKKVDVPSSANSNTIHIDDYMRFRKLFLRYVTGRVLTASGGDWDNMSTCMKVVHNKFDLNHEFHNKYRLEAQFMTRESIRNMDYKPLIQASAIVENGVVFGEDPKTIKDVYKRSTPVKLFGKNAKFDYVPFGVMQSYSSSTSAANRTIEGYLSHYRQLFRYSRGSVVLRLLNLQDFDYLSAGIQMVADKTYDGLGSQITTPSAVTDASLDERGLGNGSQWCGWNHLQPIEVAIPFFSNVFGAPNCFGLVPSTQKFSFAQLPSATIYAIGGETDKTMGTHGIVLMEAGGDDFELMFQVGPPVILTSLL